MTTFSAPIKTFPQNQNPSHAPPLSSRSAPLLSRATPLLPLRPSPLTRHPSLPAPPVSYDGQPLLFTRFNLCVSPASHCLLVGANGSGF